VTPRHATDEGESTEPTNRLGAKDQSPMEFKEHQLKRKRFASRQQKRLWLQNTYLRMRARKDKTNTSKVQLSDEVRRQSIKAQQNSALPVCDCAAA
jgi:hypothetical protein